MNEALIIPAVRANADRPGTVRTDAGQAAVLSWCGWAAAVLGCLAAVDYAGLGLTLTHYDARGHLIVARRVLDSLTPGWQQLGAVWLPLPHLLNLLPVQIDALYRTGLSGVAISIAAFTLATVSLARIVLRVTRSRAAAVIGAAAFALNPNVLYLQSTPMTEPLLLGLSLLGLARLAEWATVSDHRPADVSVGWPLALACLTRYEAWPVTGAALSAALWARWRRGERPPEAALTVGRVAIYPVAAIALFVIFSRVVVGEWFVASGFFVPENEALGRPLLAIAQIGWGVRALSSTGLVVAGGLGLFGLCWRALSWRAPFDSAAAISGIAVTVAATAALPLVAFVDGHPYRIRYMVPLIAAEALGVGAAAGWLAQVLRRPGRLDVLASRVRAWQHRAADTSLGRVGVACGALALLALSGLNPRDHSAPMVVEAQWDRPNMSARRSVTACLLSDYRGETIMASMGSLGHYMQELSASGLRLADFLHEGNGDIWLTALATPRPYAGWILVEEKAEGGDMLAHLARDDRRFLEGFTRRCEAAGVALYQRDR